MNTFSFFRAPVTHTRPTADWTLREAWHYITGPEAAQRTAELRNLTDPKAQSAFKRTRFDFCTFSGQFTTRSASGLLQHSGLLCLDFDHLENVEETFRTLLQDPEFETLLLFRSPRGHGLKWIVPIDLTEDTHLNWFRAIEIYLIQTYHIAVDASGKDVTRACFLPHDPDAYLASGLRL